jgi:hypothetical protein
MATRSRPSFRIPRPNGSALVALTVCLILGISAAGYLKVRNYVIARFLATPVRPSVELKNQPAWMSPYLAQSIVNSVRPSATSSPFDKQVLIDAYQSLSANPWVKSVREVRRLYGKAPGDRLAIDCVYRAPAALVQHDGQYILVADDGIVLPEQFTEDELPKVMFSPDGGQHTQLRIIQGVSQPPAKPGSAWNSDDLSAGLKMAALLSQLPYADEIVRIDVSNMAAPAASRSPRIVLLTKNNTQIRWGLPPGNDDFTEASPTIKLAHLQQIYAQYHCLDANQSWLDLRFDHVNYPTVQASADYR